MIVSATAKYIPVSAKKLQLLAKNLSTLKPTAALDYLQLVKKSGALPLRRAIASAVANAKGQNLDPQNLYFDQILILTGPAMKRFRAVSRGRAFEYKRRTTHIKIILKEQAQHKK